MRKLAIMVLVVAVVVAMLATPVLAEVITDTNKRNWHHGSRHGDLIIGLEGNDVIWS
jgi:hypothetical protein